MNNVLTGITSLVDFDPLGNVKEGVYITYSEVETTDPINTNIYFYGDLEAVVDFWYYTTSRTVEIARIRVMSGTKELTEFNTSIYEHMKVEDAFPRLQQEILDLIPDYLAEQAATV